MTSMQEGPYLLSPETEAPVLEPVAFVDTWQHILEPLFPAQLAVFSWAVSVSCIEDCAASTSTDTDLQSAPVLRLLQPTPLQRQLQGSPEHAVQHPSAGA